MRDKLYLQKRDRVPKNMASLSMDHEGWTITDAPDGEGDADESDSFSSIHAFLGEVDADDILYREIIKSALFGPIYFGGAKYIPASRSGLILSLKYISSSLLSSLRLRGKSFQNDFSAPVLDFLRTLIEQGGKARKSKGSAEVVAKAIEGQILKGTLSKSDEASARQYFYQPAGGNVRLPLFASSSLVTELSSVVEVLRNLDRKHAIIFEEPEAHLHLSAQLEMAKAIVRLVNAGIPMIITTHSDTFIQQLNLLITLHDLDDSEELMEKFNYRSDEVISASRVAAYELVEENGRSRVVRSEQSEFGFAVESVNSVLAKLSDQILEFD